MATKKEGILRKWTNYLGSWQNRYFVLKNGTLSYYKENPVTSGTSCRGAVSVCDASFKKSKNFGIDIILKDCSWYIRANNENERRHWLKAFQECKKQKSSLNVDQNRNPLTAQQTRQDNVNNNSIIDTLFYPTAVASPTTTNALTGSASTIKNRSSTSVNPTTYKNTTEPATSITNVALEDILDSRKTLEEKAASWKKAHAHRNTSQLLSRNPQEIFLDKHVPQALKCPICFEVFGNAVYQCQEGHSVCSICLGQISRCPLCQKRYGLQKIRNRLIEDLANTEIMSCPGFKYGCEFKGNIKSLGNHVSECIGFVVGEKSAQESSNDENGNSVGSLLVFPGIETREHQIQQLPREQNYSIETTIVFLMLLCGIIIKYFLES